MWRWRCSAGRRNSGSDHFGRGLSATRLISTNEDWPPTILVGQALKSRPGSPAAARGIVGGLASAGRKGRLRCAEGSCLGADVERTPAWTPLVPTVGFVERASGPRTRFPAGPGGWKAGLAGRNARSTAAGAGVGRESWGTAFGSTRWMRPAAARGIVWGWRPNP